MIRLIILSEIRIYYEGLSRILSDQDGIEVAASHDRLEDAVPRIEQLMPTMVLLDMTMPSSCEFARTVARSYPQISIVAIAMPADEQNIVECAEAGISGYVAREASIRELIDTVLGVGRGEFCCPPQIAAVLFSKVQLMAQGAGTNPTSSVSEPGADLSDLTRREKQILGLMTEGLSNKEIAKALVIQVSTVKNHVHNILVKLEVHSRTQAVASFQNRSRSDSRRSFDTDNSGQVCF